MEEVRGQQKSADPSGRRSVYSVRFIVANFSNVDIVYHRAGGKSRDTEAAPFRETPVCKFCTQSSPTEYKRYSVSVSSLYPRNVSRLFHKIPLWPSPGVPPRDHATSSKTDGIMMRRAEVLAVP